MILDGRIRRYSEKPFAEDDGWIVAPTQPAAGKEHPRALGLEQAHQGITWRQHLVVFGPLLIIYFALAFYRLTHQSLWVDEVASLIDADPNGLFWARGDWLSGRGPFHPRLLQLWARAFTSEFALRSLSPLLGSIAVCLVYLMSLRLGNRRFALIATLLFATSPFLIWYSQEIRYVILMMAATLFSMYAFERVLSTDRSAWWLLYGCSLILAIGTFMVNVLLPLVQGLYLVRSEARYLVWRKWLVSQLVIVVLFAWWANGGHIGHLGGHWQKLRGSLSTDAEKPHAVDPEPRFSIGSSREFQAMALPYTFFAFSTGFSLGPSVRELHITRSWPALRSHAVIISSCAVVFGSLLSLGIAVLWRRREAAEFLLIWLVVPVIVILSVSALIPSLVYNVRYAAMALPAYILILAAAIANLRAPVIQAASLTAVLAVNGLSLANYYFDPRYNREDARSAARYLEAATRPQDIVVVVGNPGAFQYYYRGNVPVQRVNRTLVGERSALSERLQRLNAQHDRVWLVEIRPWEADPQETVKAILDAGYHLSAHKELPGVGIYAYEER
ncbi:MAG TPA: glycosyltransferase family 39 protein [Alphaproteobacteria bacterium]|nr:glycosyltransferase family 39 protein [Alphaproteobacteria bacterium]